MERDELVAAAPSAQGPLRAVVGFRAERESPGDHRGLPSPFLTFIVTFDEPVRISDPAGDRDLDVLVAGLRTGPTRVLMPRVQTGIEVAIDPLAAQALFGVPASELGGRSTAGEDLLGAAAARLRERLATATEWSERFGILACEMSAWADSREPRQRPRAEIVEAWRLLEASRGRFRIGALADRVYLSRRRLSSLFAAELGVSPKQAARTMRFAHSLERIRQGVGAGELDLAATAAQCGFADQSHLVREFHQLAGSSPSGWIAEQFPNVQASGDGEAAVWAP